MSGDDANAILAQLRAIRSDFDAHLRGADERDALRERRLAGVEARMSTMEAQHTEMPAVIRKIMREELQSELRDIERDGNAENFEALMTWIKRTFATAATGVVMLVLAYVVNQVLR